jgi:ABC1 atypical kinase-like domain
LISRIAVRHGLGPYLRGRRRGEQAARGRAALAVSLRQALEEGGVTFTKLGQLLSTRRDLLPEEFIAELTRLQDRAEPAPWEQVEEVIAQSLGAPGQVFAELQQEPAAAASIAQVHKAWLRRDGGRTRPGEFHEEPVADGRAARVPQRVLLADRAGNRGRAPAQLRCHHPQCLAERLSGALSQPFHPLEPGHVTTVRHRPAAMRRPTGQG